MRDTVAMGIAVITCAALHASAAAQTLTNMAAEVSFQAKTQYANPFMDVELDVLFTDPVGTQVKVPAFWAGDNTWKVRYASPVAGVHLYRTVCTETSDAGLHGVAGRVKIKTYTGDNSLYRHGPLQVAETGKHFVHADGTPFFWLGDTWWKGLCKRLPWEGFKELTADRKAKGYSVVQIICGPYPDEPEFDLRWKNEGGMPYDKTYTRINPEYFHYADRRIEHLVEQNIVPAIFGAWGYHIHSVGAENMKRYWRYLIARYGAYPVVWVVVGEAFKGGHAWRAVAEYVREIDPYSRVSTIHSNCGRDFAQNDALIDFDMMMPAQGGSFDEEAPLGDWRYTPIRTSSMVQAAVAKKPSMPVVIGEICYENHMMTNGADLQRLVFWSSFLLGAKGFTYGAEALWQMTSETVRGSEYGFTTWSEAMSFPGAIQLGKAKQFLQGYPWWRFESRPDWVDPHATTIDVGMDHNTAYSQFIKKGGRWALPYAAGIPGEVRMVYIPGHYYSWEAPTVIGLEQGVPYHAFLFCPVLGKRYEIGLVVNTGNANVSADQMEKSRHITLRSTKPRSWSCTMTLTIPGSLL